MNKKFKILLSTVLIFIALAYLSVSFAIRNVLPYSPIRPYRCTQSDIQTLYSGIANPDAVGLSWQDFDVMVKDTIMLKGWYISASRTPAQGTIIMLHGIASCKASMLPMANLFSDNGFNCILYDSRANGESGGLNCTFGYYEKKDLSVFIDSAIVRFPGSGPYAVFGSSLGAAVSIQALAEDRRLACGIAESPFAHLRDIIYDYFARMTYFHFDFIADEALKYTEHIACFKIDSVQPALSAFRVTQPTMIIHGLDDKHISAQYGKQVFDNLAALEKEWYPIPGGTHYNLSQVGGGAYHNRIIVFSKSI
ncbi:MAG: alpha/beta fold hydrolase [Bacteroidetes bacterium]|nr:alpha/beta fold hydrolase [Bacteroidota bacterium]